MSEILLGGVDSSIRHGKSVRDKVMKTLVAYSGGCNLSCQQWEAIHISLVKAVSGLDLCFRGITVVAVHKADLLRKKEFTCGLLLL